MNNEKACCFTGHRSIPAEHIKQMPSLLGEILEDLLQKGVRRFKAGGAIGFDTLCALKVLELKKNHPELSITLELCLPCKDQTNLWRERDKTIHAFVLRNADSVCYAAESYVRGCMYKRNRMLVDGSDFCVAYLTSKSGGTAYTCSYAAEKSVKIINTAKLMVADL
jgi:uncharacterized phage-like protein YoqJ